jgi:hypothetical protein
VTHGHRQIIGHRRQRDATLPRVRIDSAGRLKERYALLWLFSGTVLLILSLSRSLLEYISRQVGIFYPPSLLFLIAFLFLLLITLHFSAVISGLSEKNKRLAQEIALLRQALEELKQSSMKQVASRDE